MEGFGEVVGLFLVYKQPFWKGFAPPPHASHAMLHPIASQHASAPALSKPHCWSSCSLVSISSLQTLVSPPFPGAGLSGVLLVGAHPYKVPCACIQVSRHSSQVHTHGCSLIFAEPFCNFSVPLGLWGDTEVLPGCMSRHFCPCSLVSSGAWCSFCPIPA